MKLAVSFLIGLAVVSAPAYASHRVFHGQLNGTAKTTERILRNGEVSGGPARKAWPGQVFDRIPIGNGDYQYRGYRYTAHATTNDFGTRYLSIRTDASGCGGRTIIPSVYSPAFDPSDISLNYIGDAGAVSGAPASFVVEVPLNAGFTVVVTEMIPGAGCAGYSVTITPAGTNDHTKSDFNNDGVSDLLLQNSSTGAVTAWQMSARPAVVQTHTVASPGADWKVVATGYFDDDAFADILLQHAQTGDVAMWLMDRFAIKTGTVFAQPGLPWKVITTADFNGDGRSDVLLQHASTGDVAEWLMVGPGYIVGVGAVVAAPGPAWKVATAGDFNGDGRGDIIVQNPATGEIAQWQMNGITRVAAQTLAPPATIDGVGCSGANCSVFAAGDFDRDGFDDLYIEHVNNPPGLVEVWKMAGFTVAVGSIRFNDIPCCDWKHVGAIRANRRGLVDAVFQKTAESPLARAGTIAIVRFTNYGSSAYTLAGEFVGTASGLVPVAR